MYIISEACDTVGSGVELIAQASDSLHAREELTRRPVRVPRRVFEDQLSGDGNGPADRTRRVHDGRTRTAPRTGGPAI
jgi:hypothetical protein